MLGLCEDGVRKWRHWRRVRIGIGSQGSEFLERKTREGVSDAIEVAGNVGSSEDEALCKRQPS